MISAFMMHKTQVVDPICTKVEANELNTFGLESCYDQIGLYHCLIYAKKFNYKLALLNLGL